MSVEGYYERDVLTFQTWSCIELRIAWTRLPLKLPRWMRLGRRMQTLEPASHHCRNGPSQIASLQSDLKIMLPSFLGKATWQTLQHFSFYLIRGREDTKIQPPLILRWNPSCQLLGRTWEACWGTAASWWIATPWSWPRHGRHSARQNSFHFPFSFGFGWQEVL